MFRIRLVEDDIDDVIYEYEGEIAPRVGEIIDWTDGPPRDLLEVVRIFHRLAPLSNGDVKFIGMVAAVRAIARDDAYALPALDEDD